MKLISNIERLFKFDFFRYIKVQPLQGCCFISLIFRGLTPTVIKITPFQGFEEPKVRRT
jgi:hypothetical protein